MASERLVQGPNLQSRVCHYHLQQRHKPNYDKKRMKEWLLARLLRLLEPLNRSSSPAPTFQATTEEAQKEEMEIGLPIDKVLQLSSLGRLSLLHLPLSTTSIESLPCLCSPNLPCRPTLFEMIQIKQKTMHLKLTCTGRSNNKPASNQIKFIMH